MINLQIDADAELRRIEKALGDAQSKAPAVLSRAANATASEAKKLMSAKLQETYALKSASFTKKGKALEVVKGSRSKPGAIVMSSGTPIELFKFKTSPATYKTGEAKPKKTKARVKSHGGMKDLLVDGRWAFVTQFSSGHKTLVQRTSDKRLPVKTLYGPSIPSMLGNKIGVYSIIKPQIEQIFRQKVDEELQKELAKGASK